MIIVNTIICAIFVFWGIMCAFSSRKFHYFKVERKKFWYNNDVHWLFIVVVSSFFFGSNVLSLGRVVIFTLLCLFIIIKKKWGLMNKEPILRSFVVFYLWLLYTMTYSEGVTQGLLMLVKYIIPIIFFIFSYHAIQKEHDYIAWLHRINRINLIYIFIHGIAPIGLLEDSLFGWEFWGGAHGYSMAVFLGVPLTLYVKTGKKKYLLYALLYSLPAVTYIRRAAFGAYCIVMCLFLIYRYKLKGTIVICASLVVVIMAVFAMEPIKERVFGGDKGDASSVTMKDFERGEVEFNSSGRDVMWEIVWDKFYKGNEIKGVGLGTMKRFITSDSNEHRDNFMILHNDYLHLLCETGIIGVGLWITFFLTIMVKMLKVLLGKNAVLLKYSALTAMGAFFAIGFIMYFANVVSGPFLFMQPFMLLGFHLKLWLLAPQRLSQSSNKV